MSYFVRSALTFASFAALALPASADETAFRILFGLTDNEPQRWDGSLQVTGARADALEPWRFEADDRITGTSWNASTHAVRLFSGGRQFVTQGITSVVANGIILRVSTTNESSEVRVRTAQGNFEFRPATLEYGTPIVLLNGRVAVERIPASMRLSDSRDEEDYPSAAKAPNGDVWIAYMQFKHSPSHNQLRAPLATPLQTFAPLKTPTGGDQVFARRYSSGSWSSPVAITSPGGDRYRTAIAVDGSGIVWIFWSENREGNFDIWTAPLRDGKPGTAIQISKDAGSDIDPVAATDSAGRVWLAWQGWRNGHAAILLATQSGGSFSSPQTISQSAGNEWNPSIAADRSGRIAVAWDSYRNGNYDVYVRVVKAPGQWGPETAVAATPRYEAYPSIGFAPEGRLWIAYEEGGAGWGKDFGAYNTTGVALYQGRLIRLRAMETDGRIVELSQDVASILPGTPSLQVNRPGSQNQAQAIDPDPENARTREAHRPARNVQAARNSFSRLAVDASGRLWLAFRSMHPIWWSPIGTVWSEYVISFDGRSWTMPIYLDHSDNLLDNRPALVSSRDELIVIGSADGRRQFQPNAMQQAKPNAGASEDPYNNDLWAQTVRLGPAHGQADVRAVSLTSGGNAPPDSGESVAVRRIREYRSNAAGGLRIVRGEFHRHSEISSDGGFDGSLLDQWRYIIDAGGLDWVGCCDHDNGGGREYSWWIEQKLTDVFYSPGRFVPMFSYERSVPYPEGHRNVVFVQRGIRPLPRLPISSADDPVHAPDTQMLYSYLKVFGGVAASHTSGTSMGTDWRDNDPDTEPVVEIYQGDRQNYEMPDAPRSNSEKDSIGGWKPKGFISLALEKGYRLGFQASSDHVSTHMSYCNIYVKEPTREAVLDGLRKRHVYASTDNILAEVRSGSHMMGDAFSVTETPELEVKLAGTAPFAKVHVIKDNRYVYVTTPNSANISFRWKDMEAQPGRTSYYYIRGEQANGELVWASPMWITYTK